MSKCKHDIGWSQVKRSHLFVDRKGIVHIGFGYGSSIGNARILFECNNTKCNAVRNIYLKAEVVKFGKIKMLGGDDE